MTDIVERLRTNAPCASDIGCCDDVMAEAADEIERLREEVKYLDRLNRGTASTEEVALRLLKKFDERDAAHTALEGK